MPSPDAFPWPIPEGSRKICNMAARLGTSLVTLTALTAIATVARYFRQILIAGYFGADGQTDALFASSVAVLISVQLLGNSLLTVFVPIYLEIVNTRGREAGRRYCANLLNLSATVTLLLSACVFFAAPQIVGVLAPGFAAEQTALATRFLRLFAPLITLNAASGVLTGLLHARRRFAVREVTGLLAALLSLVVMVALRNTLGVSAAAWGAVAASCGQFLLILGLAAKAGYRHLWVWDITDYGVRRSLRLSAPILVGTTVGFLAPVLDRVFASYLTSGSLSSLDYAEKLITVFSSIVIMPLNIVLLTSFAELHQQRRTTELLGLVTNSMRTLSYVVLPCAAILVVLAGPLVNVFFQRGAFNASATDRTFVAVQSYSFWMLSLGLNSIANRLLYAMQVIVAPVTIGIVGTIVNVLLKYILVAELQQAGLALATSLASIFKTMLLLMLLKRLYVNFALGSLLRSLVHSLLMTAPAMYATWAVFTGIFGDGFASKPLLARLSMVAGSGVAGVVVYVGLSYATHSRELETMTAILSRIFVRRKAASDVETIAREEPVDT